MSMKDTNPKDAVGVRKWRQYCTVPTTVIWELGVAMLEGARKYGRHNYRVAGVRASVYLDAAKGHIDCFWEGEDLDPDSGLSHITKAMASLAVLRDAMVNEMWTDDRPPKVKDFDKFKSGLQGAVESILDRFPDAREPFTELGERLKAAGLPTVTPAEIATRLAEEKSRAALKAKRDALVVGVDAGRQDEIAVQVTKRVGQLETRETIYRGRDVDEVWVDDAGIGAPEPGLGDVGMPARFDVAHDVDGVPIVHPDSPEFDRIHIFGGLTTKQFCNLVRAAAKPGEICGMNHKSESGNLAISHPIVFDRLARAVMERIMSQPSVEVRLDFAGGGFRESKTRLTADDWATACPGVRVTMKPYHGMVKP